MVLKLAAIVFNFRRKDDSTFCGKQNILTCHATETACKIVGVVGLHKGLENELKTLINC